MIKLGKIVKYYDLPLEPDVCQVIEILSSERIRIKSLLSGRQKTVNRSSVVTVS